jgi:hypothetical protein
MRIPGRWRVSVLIPVWALSGFLRVARNPPGAGRSARWRLLVRMALLTFRYRRLPAAFVAQCS